MQSAAAASLTVPLRRVVAGATAGGQVSQGGCRLGPVAEQVRHRQWLFPMATKGFRPERFEHMGQALQLARESKRIPIWKLAWAAGTSKHWLAKVEAGNAALLPEHREEVERLLGVKLKRQRKSKFERAP
mmetsp:Transcript_8471/g.25611  ORF Transcript_8471/g.25611 Transcript_8471/m.25611 type:complete len:130 (-) Transcript_8471:80-469(-)